MKILVTGASGLVGSALLPLLAADGHTVVPLARKGAGSAEGDAWWEPESGAVSDAALGGADALVHLAGENIAAGRWTASRKEKIRASRVEGTGRLCRFLAGSAHRPCVFVAASAIGFYGDRGEEVLTEESAAGTGFLADVCRAWEAAAAPLAETATRVVHLRIGAVLSPHGGALARMLPVFRLGTGGSVGSGRQYQSWIALDDLVAAVRHVLVTERLSGPVNATAPNPVTNHEFAGTLGRVLRRPAVATLPAFAARLALGELADALLLASTRVVPKRLEESGFRFSWPQLEDALRHVVATE